MKFNNCFCKDGNNEDFFKWYIELLGPVILGVKPAEILSFPEGYNENTELLKRFFEENTPLRFEEYTYCSKCTKLFIYHPIALEKTISEYKNVKFLKGIGYPSNFSVKEYVDFILNKMRKGQIPDEIGVFLGYPLKDVLGFMGHPSLKLTKVDGWRVYGDERLSHIKRQSFISAREEIRSLLLNKGIEGIMQLNIS